MTKSVNVAVIGCGYWGPNMARVFSQTENSCLHTCCDLDEAKLKRMKSLYNNVETTKDYKEVLNNPDIHAVIIATPTAAHFALAKEALLHNKHVLLEKPMTNTIQEAEELLKLSKEKNKVLMIDHTFEYNPAIRKMKEIIESGELGDIYFIHANWLNLGLLQPEVNVIFDLATHIFSIINYLTGYAPLSIHATGMGYFRKDIEEVANITVNYPNDILATMRVSWLDPIKTRTMTVVGSKKMMVFDLLNAQEMVKVYDQSVAFDAASKKATYRVEGIYSPNISNKEALKTEAEHFVDCILNNKQPLSSAAKGLDLVKVLYAANVSLKNYEGDVKL